MIAQFAPQVYVAVSNRNPTEMTDGLCTRPEASRLAAPHPPITKKEVNWPVLNLVALVSQSSLISAVKQFKHHPEYVCSYVDYGVICWLLSIEEWVDMSLAHHNPTPAS